MAVASSALLPAWAGRLLREFDEADEQARALLAGCAAELLNRKVATGTWSMGQCVDHLAISAETYLPAIRMALQGAKCAPVAEFQHGWFARWFIASFIEPSKRTKKAKAPGKIKPRAEVGPDVLQRFLAANEASRQLVREAARCDVNTIRFKNPYLPGIRFTVGTGLQILASHNRRHLLQAERVKAALSGL